MYSKSCRGLDRDSINLTSGNAYSTGHSLAFELLHQAAKAFKEDGCQKSGAYVDFGPYLSECLKSKNYLITFQHQRFNVAFHQGGAVYHHRSHILEFIESGRCGASNKLIDRIAYSIKQPVVLAQCRALGVLSKLICGPIMRLLERTDLSYFDMNKHWKEIRLCLHESSINSESLLLHQKQYISDSVVTEDEIYETLFCKSEQSFENLTMEALQSFCKAMCDIIDRQLSTQLPGGSMYNPTPELEDEVRGAPLTNVRSESDFSDLDRAIKQAPQKSRLSKSGTICFNKNKTSLFLNKLPENIKQKYLRIARKQAPLRKIEEIIHAGSIKSERLQLQANRVLKKKQKAEKKTDEIEQLINRIKNQGVWVTETEVTKQLASLPVTQHSNVIKDQIRYRVKVLKCKLPSSDLAKWQNAKAKFSSCHLAQNLKKIIRANPHVPKCVLEINKSVRKSSKPLFNTRKGKGQKPSKCRSKRRNPTEKNSYVFGVQCLVSGMLVAVAYNQSWFVSQIERVTNNMVDIKCMHRSGNSFYWPSPKDDTDSVDSKFVLCEVQISPLDANLRQWSVNSIGEIDSMFKAYKTLYFD